MYAEVKGFAATQSWCEDALGLVPAEDDQSMADGMKLAMDAAPQHDGHKGNNEGHDDQGRTPIHHSSPI